MKKLRLLLCAFLILFFTSTAFAWWSVNAHINVVQTRVYGWVKNRHNRPIVCSGHVYGKTYYGQILNSWMNIIIPPYEKAGVYVYTSPKNPFVGGWGNIECRWY